jgi:histidinol-phosphate phosphatase family protein
MTLNSLAVDESIVADTPGRISTIAKKKKRGAIFLDKDGTLLNDVPYNIFLPRMEFAPTVSIGLRLLAELNVPLISISNQPGVALGRFEEQQLRDVECRLQEMFGDIGALLTAFRWCPHAPNRDGSPACNCRKPMPGLLTAAAEEFGIDLKKSWMIGSNLDGIETGSRAGCRTVLIDNGSETQWKVGPNRTPDRVARDFGIAARWITEEVAAKALGTARS